MKTVTLEVKALARVLKSADGGCPTCTREIAEEMQELDPAHDWVSLVCGEEDDD
jgi:hypothetical protein